MAKKYWIILGGLGLLILISIFSVQAYAESKLRDVLQITTSEGDSLRFQELSFSLFSGDLRLDSVKVHWIINNDPEHEGLSYKLDGRFSSLRLSGISVWSYLMKKEFVANRLLLTGPSLNVIGLTKADSVQIDSSAKAAKNQGERIIIKIAAIEVEPTHLSYRTAEQEQAILEIDSFTFLGQDIHLPAPQDASPLPEDIKWSARNLVYLKPGSASDLHIGHLAGNSLDSNLQLQQIKVTPRHDLATHRRLHPHENSQLTLDIGRASMAGFGWLSLLEDPHLIIQSIELEDFSLNAFEDGSVSPKEGVVKPLYQEQLLTASLPISIDSIRILSGHIRYELLPVEAQQTGHIDFDQFYASIYNVTNDSARIAEDPHLYADIESNFQNQSKLKIHFDMLLDSPNYAYTSTAEMQNFSLPALNTFLKHASKMEIKEGMIEELSFHISANKYRSGGDLIFIYDGLKIEWTEGHNIFTALGQKIFVREKNPRGDKFRQGKVYFERVSNRSFWHLFYNSLVSGLQSTALPNMFLPDELDVEKKNRKLKKQK